MADRILFAEFLENPERHLAEIVAITKEGLPVTPEEAISIGDNFPIGENIKVTASVRRGHSFFKRAVYANFEGRCAMTGLRVPQFTLGESLSPVP